LNLTVAQLNLFVEVIGDRLRKDNANQAMIMRMAVVASLTKEGNEAFQKYIDEVFETPKLIIASSDLTKFGLEQK